MSILRTIRSLEGHLGPLEASFRADHLNRDRRQCEVLVLLSVVGLLFASLASAWQFGSARLIAGGVLLGSVLSALGLAMLMFLSRARTARTLDGLMLIWSTFFLLGVVIAIGTTDVHAGFAGVVVVVIVVWHVLPQPLEIRALMALLLSLPVGLGWLGPISEGPDDTVADLLVLVGANLFGIWFSVDNHRLARMRYRLLDTSRRLRDRAARMQRLLPVCAWCGDLRDEAGYWRAVHEFIDSDELDTTARTVCEDCAAGGDAALRRPAVIDRESPGSLETWESARFRSARRHVAILMGATMLLVAGLMTEMFLGGTESVLSSTTFGIRVLELVICALVLVVALSTGNRRLFEGILTGWATLMGLAILVQSYLGAPNLTLSVIALATTSWPLLLPVPRWQRAIPAGLALAGGLLICYGPNAAEALGARAHHYAAALVSGLLVGLGFSTANERRRRELFEATREAQVEQRLVERLGELLPVCRVCHSVRDEDGYWRDVRAYLQTRAGGRATHGICEDCLQEQFGVDPDPDRRCRHDAPTA
jgi:hypothetical protein